MRNLLNPSFEILEGYLSFDSFFSAVGGELIKVGCTLGRAWGLPEPVLALIAEVTRVVIDWLIQVFDQFLKSCVHKLRFV